MMLDKPVNILKKLDLKTGGLRPINIDEMSSNGSPNYVKYIVQGTGCGVEVTERDLQRIPNDGDTTQGSFGISDDTLTSFPYFSENIRKNFCGIFSFMEEIYRRFVLHNIPFKNSVLRGFIELMDIP